MNNNNKNEYTTFSMILGQLIMNKCEATGIPLTQLYEQSGVSQATWSRIMRGQTKLGVEDLFNLSKVAGLSLPSLMRDAESISEALPTQNVEVSEPIGTKSKNGETMKVVLASAALAFLISRLLK
ncbi:helix-turn-helix domain-containing protein [Kordiimonas laminariae]|uniref:helix-turn-helix domain-containing protein n=1 Tax=Kordiimonas laminariae TaxID=2917717 RepID=UPI001FF30BD6|nr:helix-turn-helix transcriptional regulator [Kordiimonas laminariae]MCK0070865.1 helix-turn-helix domain-containing protein [Kordiimonas laminariae]